MRIYKIPQVLFKLFPQIHWKDTSDSDLVYLTFDDGPDPNHTPKILNILGMQNVRATFFVLSDKAAQNKKLIERTHQEGHEIGIHSFTHKRLWFRSEQYIYDQLDQSKRIIEKITGECVRFFRPPFGVFSKRLLKICAALNLELVMWSLMTYDFDVRLSERSILKLILSRVECGEIIVFHDGHVNSDRTVKILEPVIHIMKEKGLKLVSLSK